MFKNLSGIFSSELSIDLGTANTLIYVKGEGIILNEPSIVAIQQNVGTGEPKKVVAVGLEAKTMLGRTPGNITTIRPLKDGVIADFNATEKMLQYFINKVHRRKLFRPRPRVLICVPCGATQVERRAIRESVLGTLARDVYLIDEPMAAAIGAGLPVEAANGSMVIDIGGGTAEIAIISLNGIVSAQSVRIGGDRFDESIINYVRRNYGTLIGESTAEKIKTTIGCAHHTSASKELEVRGRNLAEGVPKTITLSSREICDALQEPLNGIIAALKNVLELAPPELAADIAEHGILLTGGGALLTDIDKLIHDHTGLPVRVAEDPLTCVVRGGGIALDGMEQVRGSIIFTE